VEPDPLFVDPFSAELAGPDAVKEAERLAKPFPADMAAQEHHQQQPPALRRRRFCYSNVGVRVWWFDQQLLAALRGAGGGGRGSSDAAAPAPRQVVVFGAGFDTRPWRLDLPDGVSWFEIDLPEIIDAKRHRLTDLHASLGPKRPAGGGGNPDGGAVAAHSRHPLRAASWAALSADLQRPGWAAALVDAGLDPSRPTVWVAEGLLMYLTHQQSAALLHEAAGEWGPLQGLGNLAHAGQLARGACGQGRGAERSACWVCS
jgi:O-methyltransferase involved in polyketide biosynthesis